MIYNGRYSPPIDWPPLIRYPNYYSHRRLSLLWFLILAIICLILSVTALIIVFAIDHSWFRDNFNGGLTQYGLWRLCFTANNTCDSWFSSGGTYTTLVEQRLNQSKTGINAWQALEIIFLFLTVATLLITIVSVIYYQCRNSLHYYLAILAVFCVWPAAIVGIAVLFVFGFAVYNVASQPRELDWCFYVNLAAVVLVVIAAILLSIYDILLRKPTKDVDDEGVIETFADLNGYPNTLSPSTFVVVRRNKQKRNKPYHYAQTLHPNQYFPKTASTVVSNGRTNTDYLPNTNHQMLAPYTSTVTTRETNNIIPQQPPPPQMPYRGLEHNRSTLPTSSSLTTISPQSYQRPFSAQQYQTQPSPPPLYRTRTNPLNQTFGYNSEPSNDYVERGFYNPIRPNLVERPIDRQQEPRVLHYYTGYDYFATIEPTDVALTRHHPPLSTPGSAIRYPANPSYHHSNDYIKSTM